MVGRKRFIRQIPGPRDSVSYKVHILFDTMTQGRMPGQVLMRVGVGTAAKLYPIPGLGAFPAVSVAG